MPVVGLVRRTAACVGFVFGRMREVACRVPCLPQRGDAAGDDRTDGQCDGRSRREQVVFVADRPGHDLRYAIDAAKIQRELGWTPRESFESGLRKTVEWYLAERAGWCRRVLDGSCRLERLGLGGGR